MLVLVVAALLIAGAIYFTLMVRPEDLAPPEPVSPTQHLEQRKAAIYENLRDLQFEFRLGKLSEADYQKVKQDLQADLAGVLAEIDRIQSASMRDSGAPPAPAASQKVAKSRAKSTAPDPALFACSSCGASFQQDLKFCGECGQPMQQVRAS